VRAFVTEQLGFGGRPDRATPEIKETFPLRRPIGVILQRCEQRTGKPFDEERGTIAFSKPQRGFRLPFGGNVCVAAQVLVSF